MFTNLGEILSRVESVEEGRLLRVRRARLVEASGAAVAGALRLGRGGDEDENMFSGSRADSIM